MEIGESTGCYQLPTVERKLLKTAEFQLYSEHFNLILELETWKSYFLFCGPNPLPPKYDHYADKRNKEKLL